MHVLFEVSFDEKGHQAVGAFGFAGSNALAAGAKARVIRDATLSAFMHASLQNTELPDGDPDRLARRTGSPERM